MFWLCVPTERNRKAKADHPGIMKPLRSVQQQVSPLGRSVNWAGHRRAAVGRWGSRGGGGCTITPDSTRIRHLKHNTISYWDNPPPLCKSSILHIHFFLGNAINSRYRCMLFLFFFFFHITTPQTWGLTSNYCTRWVCPLPVTLIREEVHPQYYWLCIKQGALVFLA